MVIGYHIIITAYGWWLPNDPRGSTSNVVASDVIAELGELHFGRKKVQPASREIRAFYDRAAQVLKHPLLEFDRQVRQCIADAFGQCIKENRYTCYALAILQDHSHILLRKHKHQAEQMIENLQRTSAEFLHHQSLRSIDHPVWATGGWKVFLDEPDDIWRTIRYIANNPRKHHLPSPQHPFVTAYDNWPLRNASA